MRQEGCHAPKRRATSVQSRKTVRELGSRYMFHVPVLPSLTHIPPPNLPLSLSISPTCLGSSRGHMQPHSWPFFPSPHVPTLRHVRATCLKGAVMTSDRSVPPSFARVSSSSGSATFAFVPISPPGRRQAKAHSGSLRAEAAVSQAVASLL